MKRQVKYLSELGRSFDTPDAAIEDDRRIPRIIATYEGDLVRMEAGGLFAGKPVTDELKEQWRHAIAGYKAQWAEAQASWENAEVPAAPTTNSTDSNDAKS